MKYSPYFPTGLSDEAIAEAFKLAKEKKEKDQQDKEKEKEAAQPKPAAEPESKGIRC